MAKKKASKGDKKGKVRALKRSELENAKGGQTHGSDVIGRQSPGLHAVRHDTGIHVPLAVVPKIKH